jgi:hypothetical protein
MKESSRSFVDLASNHDKELETMEKKKSDTQMGRLVSTCIQT